MRFPLIDVLRGFAALTVVVFHVIAHFEWTNFPVTGPLVWFRAGGMGVDLFFVVSGFVIALSAFSRLGKDRVGIYRRAFTRARLRRIVPLYYLTCLIFMIFVQPSILFDPSGRWQILTHALFLQNLFLTHFGGLNGVNWSVAIELQFYMVMLIFGPWLVRLDWRWLLMGGISIAWIWRLIAFAFVNIHGAWSEFLLFVAVSQLPGMLDEFTIGVLLARFVRTDQGRYGLDWLAARPAIPIACASGLMWVTLSIYWHNASYWDSVWMVVFFKTLLGLAWGAVLVAACTLRSPLLLRACRPLRYLGVISYGIYLWHLPIILALRRVTWLDGPTALPYVLGVTLLVAAGSWHFFEKPLLEPKALVRRA